MRAEYLILFALTAAGVFFSSAALGFCTGAFLLAALWRLGGRGPALSPRELGAELAPYLPLALSVLYGIFISEDWAEGWKAGKSTLLILFLPVYAEAARRLRLGPLLSFMVLALGVEFAIACDKAALSGAQDWRFTGARPFGTDAQICLMIAIFCLYAAALNSLLGWAGLFTAIPFLMLTQSRQTSLALVLLIPVLTACLGFRRLLPPLVCAVVLAAATYTFSPYRGIERVLPVPTVRAVVAEAAPVRTATSMGTRYELWMAAWISFSETRWRGTGYGDFHSDIHRYMKEGTLAADLNTTLHIHSIYLQILMCAGWPGLMGLIWTLAWLGLRLLSRARAAPPDHAARIQLLLLLSLVLTGFVDAHLDDGAKNMAYAYFFALAAALGGELRPAKINQK